MVGERRVITMLFCDVKGSTAAAEKVDPETWTDIMNGVFEYMIRPIYKYEGLVPRLMGDAILAFFGAPITHEDDPQRAVLAGLEIQEGIKPYAEEIRRKHGLEFGLRVGINTGLVVVGEIGSDLRMEYTAIGDAINLAARMEQTAAVGTIQISDIVLGRPIKETSRENPQLWAECIVGAVMQDDYLQMFRDAGFRNVTPLSTLDYFAKSAEADTREVAASYGARTLIFTGSRPG